MAIRDLQIGLAEMGRIRLGQRVPKRNGSGVRPDKLDTFKFTSPAEHLITEIAALYGGTPGPFVSEGVRGKQFQVVTDINIIPVYLPRQKIDPFYEQWGSQVCTRRCDGERDMIHDKPCDCDPDKRTCKPTTRVNLMLAHVSGPGYWRLETHGIYAAMELSQLAMLLQAVTMPLPAKLLLEARQRKFFNRAENKVEVRDWFTPIVILDNVTPYMLATGGEVLAQAIQGAPPAAVEGPQAARAIEATPAVPAAPDPKIIERGLAMISSATPAQMPDIHARIEKMNSPQALVDAFKLRLADHAIAAKGQEDEAWAQTDTEGAPAQTQEAAGATGPDVSPSTTQTVDAVVVDDEGDRSAAMMGLLGVAGKLKINTKQLDEKIFEHYGVARMVATTAQLSELAAKLKVGSQ